MTAPAGSVARVLEIARSELGTEETPRGSNRTEYGKRYGMDGVAWCAMFVWDVFTRAGVPLPIKTAYTPTLAAAFQKDGRWLSNVSRDVAAGDVVLFYWPSMGRIAHTGIVELVLPNGDIQTIEGNSDVRGGRSGGKVVRQIRSRATVHARGGFGVPRYPTRAGGGLFVGLSETQEQEIYDVVRDVLKNAGGQPLDRYVRDQITKAEERTAAAIAASEKRILAAIAAAKPGATK